MSPKTPKDAGSDMAILRRLYCEAYNEARTVDEDAADLVREAYIHDQISWEEAQRQWWAIVDQTVDPSSKLDSVQ